MSASGNGRLAVNRIVPFESEKPSGSARTTSIAAGENGRGRGDEPKHSLRSTAYLTGDLKGRHAVADTGDSVPGHLPCDVDDALQRVVLRLR